MYKAIRYFGLALSAVLSFGAASEAHAQCRGQSQIDLSDDSVACVLKNETTEITRTQSIVGGGPAASRKSVQLGGLVVVKSASESSAKGLSSRTIASRAKEICKRYRADFLAKIDRPGNPFMVVVLTWGDNPRPTFGREPMSVTLRQVFLTRNCWVREQR